MINQFKTVHIVQEGSIVDATFTQICNINDENICPTGTISMGRYAGNQAQRMHSGWYCDAEKIEPPNKRLDVEVMVMPHRFNDMVSVDPATLDFGWLWTQRCMVQDAFKEDTSFSELDLLIAYYTRIMVELRKRYPNDESLRDQQYKLVLAYSSN